LRSATLPPLRQRYIRWMPPVTTHLLVPQAFGKMRVPVQDGGNEVTRPLKGVT